MTQRLKETVTDRRARMRHRRTEQIHRQANSYSYWNPRPKPARAHPRRRKDSDERALIVAEMRRKRKNRRRLAAWTGHMMFDIPTALDQD